jgi:FAD/FMN-containing dehydrogenase
MAHVQCGVSFDELQKELKNYGLKIQTPVGVTHDSAVKGFVNRAVIKSSAKYPEAQVTNMYVTLPDGSLYKTGSHALDEMACDSPDGAAYLSYWYLGARDIYGVVSRASIVLYPVWEKRDVLSFDFNEPGSMFKAMRDIPRREIGTEYLGMNSIYMEKLTGIKGGKWTQLTGFDGYAVHVDWQEKTVRKYAEELGGRENRNAGEIFLKKIDDVWPVMGPYHTSFLTLFNRTLEFDEIIRRAAERNKIKDDDIGKLFVSMDRGRSVSCLYEFYNDSDRMDEFVDELNLELLKYGAYFDTPQGDLSKSVFDSIEGYSAHLRRIKDMIDPKGILNPGILKF